MSDPASNGMNIGKAAAKAKLRSPRRGAIQAPWALHLAALTAAIGLALPLLGDVVVINGPAAGRIAAPAAPEVPAPPLKADKKEHAEPAGAFKAPKDPLEPGNVMDRAAESGNTVFVGETFTGVERIRTARRLMAQGRAQEAITAFQEIVNEFSDKLVYLKTESFVSIPDYCRAHLIKIPEVSQGLYETLYGGAASAAISGPLATRDMAELGRATDRFFCSLAALSGLSQAAEWSFERGEFSAAARTWALLVTHPRATPAQKAEFLHHAVLAEKFSGREDIARTLRDRLAKEAPNATGIVSGKEVNLAESATEALKGLAWEITYAAPDEWPQMGGSARRDVRPDVNSTAGARLWSVSFDSEAIAGSRSPAPRPVARPNVYRRPGVVEDNSAILRSHPVLSNGTLLVHAGNRIAALSANAGTLLWTFPPAGQAAGNREQEEQERMMMNNYGISYRASGFDAPAVFENQVFAVLPATTPAPAVQPGRNFYGGYMPQPNNRLVAVNRTDGAEIWNKPLIASDITLKDTTGYLSFVGSPVVTRQGVYVMARKSGGDNFSHLYLVRVDRNTGEVGWVCYLCSAGGQGYGPSPTANRIPVPTIVDDVVYISTGQGADAAVDANAGRIQWLQITDTAKVKPNPNGYYNMQMETNPSWKFNPPLVQGEKLITYEINGAVRIYDRWSGILLARHDRKRLGNIEVTAGFHNDYLITVGTGEGGIRAIDLKGAKGDAPSLAGDGLKTVWSLDPKSVSETGKLAGRPFLAKGLLYVPYERGLLIVDLEKKAFKDFSDWPKTEKDEPGKAGNMIVTTEQIVVISDREVAGYSRWETARDNRLMRIKAAPNQPEPYLSLAEIAFRTNHFDLAEENLRKSVTLAVNPGSGVSDELRNRLYRTSLNFAEQLLGKTDIALRARARFYYEQSRLTAYSAETQSEWRLSMTGLSLAEEKWPEAATLYNEVMSDSGMRGAPYRKGDTLARAGVIAEQQMKALIERLGKKAVTDPADVVKVDAAGRDAVYKPFEALAKTALGKARADQPATRIAALAGVVEAYPNSVAALAAATDLAAAQRGANQPADAIKTLRWLYNRAGPDARPQVIADLAMTHAAISRWTAALSWADRGTRYFKDATVIDAGKQQTFAALRDGLRARMPGNIEGRRPALPLPRAEFPHLAMERELFRGPDAKEDSEKFFARGFLLAPIEQAATFRRPDTYFVFRQGRIRMFDTVTASDRWPARNGEAPGVELPENASTVLLGSYGDVSIFVQANQVIAIDTAAGKIKWKQDLSMNADERSRLTELSNRIRNAQMQEMQRRGGGGMIYDPETGQYYNTGMSPAALAADPDVGRNHTFNERLGAGQAQFTTMRMIGGKLVIVTGAKITAYDMQTGQPAWNTRVQALPEGVPSVIVGNEDLTIVQVDDERSTPTFRVFETAGGKLLGDIKLNDEKAAWRGLSEDGFLFIVTDQSVSAYDCFNLGGTSRAVWRRDDIRVKWATASAITLDGLVLVNDKNDLVCLSPEGGEYRWPLPPATSPRLTLPVNAQQGGWTYLRSYVDGDQIIYQTQTGILAYYSNGDISWRGAMNDGASAADYPPLTLSQLSDPYVITFANGNKRNGRRGAMIIVHDRRPGMGRICLRQPLTKSPTDDDPPMIRQWQIVDNGLVIEIAGQVYVYRAGDGKNGAGKTP